MSECSEIRHQYGQNSDGTWFEAFYTGPATAPNVLFEQPIKPGQPTTTSPTEVGLDKGWCAIEQPMPAQDAAMLTESPEGNTGIFFILVVAACVGIKVVMHLGNRDGSAVDMGGGIWRALPPPRETWADSVVSHWELEGVPVDALETTGAPRLNHAGTTPEPTRFEPRTTQPEPLVFSVEEEDKIIQMAKDGSSIRSVCQALNVSRGSGDRYKELREIYFEVRNAQKSVQATGKPSKVGSDSERGLGSITGSDSLRRMGELSGLSEAGT